MKYKVWIFHGLILLTIAVFIVACQQGSNSVLTEKSDTILSEAINCSEFIIPEDFQLLREENYSCGGQTNLMRIYHHSKTGLQFVLIPGGTFMMGSNNCDSDEKPMHQVIIEPLLLCQTECTQEAWDKIEGNDNRGWGGHKLPIDNVSWDACFRWCQKAGLRLPTEAEWEYACKAGTSTRFYFGDSDSILSFYAWFNNSGGKKSHAVGQKKPNAFGLYDMHGNLWEWCQDIWRNDYSNTLPIESALESGPFCLRVYRGGGWDTSSWNCRSTDRYRLEQTYCGFTIGFRPACSVGK